MQVISKLTTMEAVLSPVIDEIITSRSLKLVSQDIIPLNVGDGNFFVAGVYRIKLTVNNGTGEKVLDLLAKSTSGTPETNIGIHCMDRLFKNEFVFYEKYVKITLPELEASIPEYYYGHVEELGKECIVIEFLQDYQMCKDFMFISNDHVELALKELGRFHGYGYLAEANDPEEYKKVCGSFVEARAGREVMGGTMYERYQYFMKAFVQRALKYIPNKESYPKEVIEKYSSNFEVCILF